MGGARMGLRLTDDYVHLEKIEQPNTIHLPPGTTDPRGTVVRARVIAVGPGEQRADGTRKLPPCGVGDIVLVHAGAGFRFTLDGRDHWFVYAERKDIIAVEEYANAKVEYVNVKNPGPGRDPMVADFRPPAA
jgi:co-chaperonin GroES (HSP10)